MKPILTNGKLNVLSANCCGIYGILFPDGKWLVGCSSSILVRLARYISGEKINLKTKVAVDKYGWGSVTGYLLEECENDKDTLLRREEYWSNKLDSYSSGYNAVPCGYGCAESGRAAPRPAYDASFKSKVSDKMKEYHRVKKLGRYPSKKYNNWKKLWAEARKENPKLSLEKNLGGYPLKTKFEIEFNKLSNWNKKRVLNIIKI